MLQKLAAAGKDVWSIGKIDDIFAFQGITKSNHTTDNAGSIRAIIDSLGQDFTGLLFANLIEFDMIHGHRNDPQGYGRALEDFDRALPEISGKMRPDDLAIISADHGVDPTTPGTDHSREHVPLLAFGPAISSKIDLGIRNTFADIAATIAANFDLKAPLAGTSFLNLLRP
jgi:phosphopentomutase